MEIHDEPKDKVCVLMTEDEALQTILSLTNQILNKNTNMSRYELFTDDRRMFTIGVKFNGL